MAQVIVSVLALLSLALPVDTSDAPSYRIVQQWTAADGLPAETVAGLAIDRDRQLWMATYDGVVRYQGFDFQHFNRDSDPALPGNRLMAIHAAPDGGVIVHFEDGRLGHLNERAYADIGRADFGQVVVFDGRVWFIDADRGDLVSWAATDGLRTQSGLAPTALTRDRFAGRLLLGRRNGRVLALSAHDSPVTELLQAGDDPILGLAASPDGELLILDTRGARVSEPGVDSSGAGPIIRWEIPQQKTLRATWTKTGWLLANLFTPEGTGPHRLDYSGIQSLAVADATSIDTDRSPTGIQYLDAHGHRWVNDGLNLFRNGKLMFRADERIRDFVVDPSGQIWIAQPARGLRLLKQSMIETLGRNTGELPDPNITLVTELKGRILVGSWVALSRLDPATGQWEQLLPRAARAALPDGAGLLVGGQGLCRLEAPGHCAAMPDFPGGSAEVLLLHRDARGTVWAGTDSGLYRRAPDGRWSPEPIDPAIARTVLEDASGRLWFGTNGDGLLVLAGHADLRQPPLRIGPRQGLESAFVRALLPVPGGAVLVGTEDAGMCLVDSRLNVARCLSTADDLPHHSVHYMLVDRLKRLWVNTNGGIYHVEMALLLAFLRGESDRVPAFSRFGERQGLRSVEGNGGVHQAGAITSDGRIWFPNQAGLVTVRSERETLRPDVPLSSRIRTLGKPGNGPVHLTSHARHLDLELTAVALAEPQNVQFRYRLGSDSEWQALGRKRRLNFRDLPPGRQRLEVEARYPHTDWLGPPAVLEFTADYRLQEHPAVRGLLLAILATGLFGLWQWGRRRRQALEQSVHKRSLQLAQATKQLEHLNDSLQRVDLQHRAALQAVGREFKAALSAILSSVLYRSERPLSPRQAEKLDDQTRTLNALIAQIDSLTETSFSEADTHQHNASPISTMPAEMSTQPNNDRPAGAESGDLGARVRMEVLLHLGDPDFSVDALARRLGMSRSVLYRRVAGFHGASPAELIRDLRLEQAARLLSESDEQISTIAYATGFRSVSSFSRAFSKKMGTSPRHWRNRL